MEIFICSHYAGYAGGNALKNTGNLTYPFFSIGCSNNSFYEGTNKTSEVIEILGITFDQWCSICIKYGAKYELHIDPTFYFTTRKQAFELINSPELEPYLIICKLLE